MFANDERKNAKEHMEERNEEGQKRGKGRKYIIIIIIIIKG